MKIILNDYLPDDKFEKNVIVFSVAKITAFDELSNIFIEIF